MMSSNRKESEEEELRRLERNRVAFEAWVQRKKEEKKANNYLESRSRYYSLFRVNWQWSKQLKESRQTVGGSKEMLEDWHFNAGSRPNKTRTL